MRDILMGLRFTLKVTLKAQKNLESLEAKKMRKTSGDSMLWVKNILIY